MADAKISALTNLTAADPTNDMIPIVDVSDTPPASGNTKRISINNILSSSPTASGALTVTGLVTAGSASITGDLTVDTSTLKVDSTNNRVGINYASPTAKLDVLSGGTSDGVYFRNSDGDRIQFVTPNRGTSYSIFGMGTGQPSIVTIGGGVTLDLGIGTYGASNLILGTDNTERARIDSSGNVGIGVSTFGTSAAKVLSIGTGTEPTTGPAGSVQFFTSTRSASNTIPAIFTEGSGVTNAAITNTTVTNKIAIKVNGTIYYLLATTSAA